MISWLYCYHLTSGWNPTKRAISQSREPGKTIAASSMLLASSPLVLFTIGTSEHVRIRYRPEWNPRAEFKNLAPASNLVESRLLYTTDQQSVTLDHDFLASWVAIQALQKRCLVSLRLTHQLALRPRLLFRFWNEIRSCHRLKAVV